MYVRPASHSVLLLQHRTAAKQPLYFEEVPHLGRLYEIAGWRRRRWVLLRRNCLHDRNRGQRTCQSACEWVGSGCRVHAWRPRRVAAPPLQDARRCVVGHVDSALWSSRQWKSRWRTLSPSEGVWRAAPPFTASSALRTPSRCARAPCFVAQRASTAREHSEQRCMLLA